MNIRSNGHRRYDTDLHVASDRERRDILRDNPWLLGSDGEPKPDAYDERFIRYRGYWYAVSEFVRCEPGGELAAEGWDGYYGMSCYSAIVVRWHDLEDAWTVGYATW